MARCGVASGDGGGLSQTRNASGITYQAVLIVSPRADRGREQWIPGVGARAMGEVWVADMEERRVTQDPKRTPRIKDPVLLRLLKYTSDECEISGFTEGLHLHHCIFKSQGGDDVRENIICLNEGLHTDYHHGDPATRFAVADHIASKRPDIAQYIAGKLGSQDALLEWYARHGISTTEGRMT